MIAAGCQATKAACLPSPAAGQNTDQSIPGALAAKSARVQGLSALCTSWLSTRLSCTVAIFVSSATIRAARASASAKPDSAMIFAT